MRSDYAISLLLLGSALACGCNKGPRGTQPAAGAHAVASASASASVALRQPVSLRGQAIALSPDESTLIVADEEHEALFVLPSAANANAGQVRVVALPGPPAQIVALAERVLVTVRTLPTEASRVARAKIRGPLPLAAHVSFLPPPKPKATNRRNTPAAPFDPSVVRASQGGLLLALRPDPLLGLVEVGRTVLAPDAWGLAVSTDQTRALVTSAWSAEVTWVDLRTMKVVATANTAREPRGIALLPNGNTAYVSHLVGSSLTRLDLDGTSLRASAQPLPAAPARTPAGAQLSASLGYDLVLSPDAQSVYAPRHALGAEGVGSWWGAPTVDVLDLPSAQPVAPAHVAHSPTARSVAEGLRPPFGWEAHAGEAPQPRSDLVQPRAVVYRRTRDTLLLASEGWDTLTEVDALAADPAMAVQRVHELGVAYDTFGRFAERGGAPTGIALDRTEGIAYVYCRSTFDVVVVQLDTGEKRYIHLAEDGLPADAAYGRRLFSNASAASMSGGLACGACHPDGRDDGYVWREGKLENAGQEARFVGRRENIKPQLGAQAPGVVLPDLYPRQTPALAGRTRSNGPFGWHGEQRDIVERLIAGFHLHRAGWDGTPASRDTGEDLAKIDYLSDFLQSGLLPPPTLERPLSSLEEQGKALFESPEVGCARCHVPGTQFTDRSVMPLRPLPPRADFAREAQSSFKTPSLWFVGGTAPYLHDGSALTLEELVRNNGNRMGNTTQLTEADRTALVSYLRVL